MLTEAQRKYIECIAESIAESLTPDLVARLAQVHHAALQQQHDRLHIMVSSTDGSQQDAEK
jgi:hypothetical protein